MPEHTSGPWIYHRPTMASPSAWIYGQDERPVCELNDNRNEYEANAHLIAAAPDLLEAGDTLCDAIGTYFETAMIPTYVRDAIKEWLDARTKTVSIN